MRSRCAGLGVAVCRCVPVRVTQPRAPGHPRAAYRSPTGQWRSLLKLLVCMPSRAEWHSSGTHRTWSPDTHGKEAADSLPSMRARPRARRTPNHSLMAGPARLKQGLSKHTKRALNSVLQWNPTKSLSFEPQSNTRGERCLRASVTVNSGQSHTT